MSKFKKELQAALADGHAGKGGSYVVDESGKRLLVERTLSRAEAAAADAEKLKTEVNDVVADS